MQLPTSNRARASTSTGERSSVCPKSWTKPELFKSNPGKAEEAGRLIQKLRSPHSAKTCNNTLRYLPWHTTARVRPQTPACAKHSEFANSTLNFPKHASLAATDRRSTSIHNRDVEGVRKHEEEVQTQHRKRDPARYLSMQTCDSHLGDTPFNTLYGHES